MKLNEIADLLKGNFTGNGELEISGIASLENAQNGEISFLENIKFLEQVRKTNASCIIVPKDFKEIINQSFIKVENPKLAFAKVAEILYPTKKRQAEIHKSAIIAENAIIGNDVFIGAFCCVGENSEIGEGTQLRAGAKVGENVKLGKNCIIDPNVFIEDNCEIGNEVILHAGVVIGTDGFGYVRDSENNKHIKFPQIGKVIIEDNVEIGANSCVDRGALGETRIGEGSKIDNQVQVAHNVSIGKRVIIAAQTGISGSVTIEDDCVIAGQVGFADHTTIKKGAVIGAKSAVFPGKIVRKGYWSGIPVMPMDEYKKLNAYIKSLPRLFKEFKKLKEALKEKK